jgi:hypothetical protein
VAGTQEATSPDCMGHELLLPQANRRFSPCRLSQLVYPSTVFRWIVDGVRLPDGDRVYLTAARLSGRYLTSEGAIARSGAVQTPEATSLPAGRDDNLLRLDQIIAEEIDDETARAVMGPHGTLSRQNICDRLETLHCERRDQQ